MDTINTRAKGFTLLELMVSMTVSAIGLIGLAGLQAASIKSNTDALKRTQANILIADITDRIRINPNGSYDIAKGTSPPSSSLACEDSNGNCSSAELALYDLSLWKCAIGSYDDSASCEALSIKGALPKGTGTITVTSSTIYTVTIEWVDYVDADGEQIASVSMTTKI
ncbi:type IV pilus modification protein PilV [Gammaproteobacteria bacterium 45_16_T64]|nr:type IV pilus modification protein PilV [Gammaproteobacteria bacterium 45_16_T64]